MTKEELFDYFEKAPKKCVATVLNCVKEERGLVIAVNHLEEIGILCNLYEYCVSRNGMEFQEFKQKYLGQNTTWNTTTTKTENT